MFLRGRKPKRAGGGSLGALLKSLDPSYVPLEERIRSRDAQKAWIKSLDADARRLQRDTPNRTRPTTSTDNTRLSPFYAKYHQADAPSNPLLFVPCRTANVFDKDIKAAGIGKLAPGGVADFHGLRSAFISAVIEHGATTKEAMELARHGSANLTFSVYARARTERLRGLAEAVGAGIPTGESATEAQRQAVGAEGLT